MDYYNDNYNPGPMSDMEKFLLGFSIVALGFAGLYEVVTRRETEKSLAQETKKIELQDLSYEVTRLYAQIDEPKDSLNATEIKKLFANATTDITVSPRWEEISTILAANYVASSLSRKQLENAYYAIKYSSQ